MTRIRLPFIAIFIGLLCVINHPIFAINGEKLAPYAYEDTRQLVTLVEEAAALIEQKGDLAFQDFAVPNSKWLNDKYYLFVYHINGDCLFHPIQPDLVGKNLIHFKDLEQKPVIALITAVGKKPEPDANGWVFYLWELPNHYAPSWKSSYIRKAITPQGKTYVVGSGLYDMKIEKIFIKERVDAAVDLILTKGKDKAFAELKDPSNSSHVLNSYIFVLDEKGNIVVDPAFPSILQRSLANFRDINGRAIVKEVQEQLKYTDSMWVSFLWHKYNNQPPSRMLAYIRKIRVGNEIFFVYETFTPAKPIWMKI